MHHLLLFFLGLLEPVQDDWVSLRNLGVNGRDIELPSVIPAVAHGFSFTLQYANLSAAFVAANSPHQPQTSPLW